MCINVRILFTFFGPVLSFSVLGSREILRSVVPADRRRPLERSCLSRSWAFVASCSQSEFEKVQAGVQWALRKSWLVIRKARQCPGGPDVKPQCLHSATDRC